jgi:hypothetical protein
MWKCLWLVMTLSAVESMPHQDPTVHTIPTFNREHLTQIYHSKSTRHWSPLQETVLENGTAASLLAFATC